MQLLRWFSGLVLLGSFVLTPHLQAATMIMQQGTEVTWHSGGTTLASNSQVQSSTVSLGANAGHLHAWCVLNTPTSGTPTANTAVVVWARVSTDGGSTFPDGSSTVTPTDAPLMSFPLRAATGNQVVQAYIQRMPVGAFQLTIRNDGTGVTLNTTWTIKCKTHTPVIN